MPDCDLLASDRVFLFWFSIVFKNVYKNIRNIGKKQIYNCSNFSMSAPIIIVVAFNISIHFIFYIDRKKYLKTTKQQKQKNTDIIAIFYPLTKINYQWVKKGVYKEKIFVIDKQVILLQWLWSQNLNKKSVLFCLFFYKNFYIWCSSQN